MKFEFKPVKKAINLGEYAGEMDAAAIEVQVNVTRDLMGRMLSVSAETVTQEQFFEMLRELWGAEDWPVEDIRALWEHCQERDPGLWKWLTGRTFDLVLEYQGLKKKE
jgi:hypothetical protein